MTFFDMIGMSVGNLFRRKLRTFLTMLGVLIGTASIVAMLSVGIGMQNMLIEEYSSYGSITQITVNEGMDSSATIDDSTKLTDTNVETFAMMEHVSSVVPVLTFDLTMKQGKYEGWAQLKGVTAEYLQSLKLGEGELPGTGGSKLEVVAGNTVITNMYDPNNFEGTYYYMTHQLPDVDFMGKATTFTSYDQYAWERQQQNISDGGETGEEVYVDNSEIRFNLKITGVLEGSAEKYTVDSDYILVDIDQLKSYLTKNYKKGEIPNQPYNAKGKPFNEWVYNSVVVNVDEAENVDMVMQNLKDMGFSAYSNKELLDSVQSTFQIIELVLGAIGMIAFLVAAIGIANTMMMSTYERTKEIGVMKVLGCDMKDIQRLFLSEAGFIGFIGGILGLLFTFALSAVANMLAGQYLAESMGMPSAKISQIPPWLALVSIAFATLMGMLAGYFPAKRAMKLSPLAAIRTE